MIVSDDWPGEAQFRHAGVRGHGGCAVVFRRVVVAAEGGGGLGRRARGRAFGLGSGTIVLVSAGVMGPRTPRAGREVIAAGLEARTTGARPLAAVADGWRAGADVDLGVAVEQILAFEGGVAHTTHVRRCVEMVLAMASQRLGRFVSPATVRTDMPGGGRFGSRGSGRRRRLTGRCHGCWDERFTFERSAR